MPTRKGARSAIPADIQNADMKIYTKTGDAGKTSLFSGRRVSKSNLEIEAYGDIDELNSYIGLAVSEIEKIDFKRFLKTIQMDLLSIGAYLSGYPQEKLKLDLRVSGIEEVIDTLDKKLPKLNNFILPGGGKLGTTLHLCRAVTRRVERTVVRYFDSISQPNTLKEKDKEIIKYLNRLSDLFFMLARFANKRENIAEEVWKE